LSEADDIAPTPAAKRTRAPKLIVAICVGLALLIGAIGLGTRYGVLLPQTRLLLESRVSGLKVGRLGKLKIEGLQGDIWRDFTIRRLTITDEKGLWLEARNLHLVWRYSALFVRRFEAEKLTAQQVSILRRPTLTPKSKSQGMPLSFHIAQLGARVEMLPAFSYRRGVYDVGGMLDIRRANGGQKGRFDVRSVLHPGDFLDVTFDMGAKRPLLIAADAQEAQGGALAGSLGLPADRPFALSVHADGRTSNGRFNAKATSGAEVPLIAQGVWTPQGGQAAGRISLKASRLTARYVEPIGPEARFQIGGSKASASLFALDARIEAANLLATARGQANMGERRTGPAGVAIVLQTPALARLVGGPAKGGAKVAGVLKGRADDMAFTGTTTVAGIETARYSLASIGGPLSITRRDRTLSIDARLAGAGGRGQGLLAALLGGAPRARLEASRLADGRLLLRNLEAAGPGLKVKATGGRGLLGQLTFKGDAELSNLAAARPGASGALRAAWSASQSGAAKPWTFTLDAKGAGFSSGYAELDRLLGAKPSLQARAGFNDGQVSVAQAKLAGAAVQADGAGVLGRDGGLGFKLAWSASGPFRAGPVEITGKAKGDGALTGTIAAPRADLSADFDQIDLPSLPLKAAHLTLTFASLPGGASGAVALTADSQYGPAKARSDFRFPEGGVDLTGLSVDAGGLVAEGSLALRRSTPSAADLRVAVGNGAFLDAGKLAGSVKIVDAPGGARATLDLTADAVTPKGAAISVRTGRLTADGPLARLPYVVNANGASRSGRWSLSGRGQLNAEDPGYALTFDGDGKLGRRELKTAEPAMIRFGGPTRGARLRLVASDGGRVELDAEMTKADADIRASVARLGLGLFNEDLDGNIDATLALQGRGDQLAGTLSAKLAGARGRGSDAVTGLDGAVQARLADRVLVVRGDVTNGQGLKANVDVSLPAEASASPLRLAINRTQPIHGKFFADGEVKPLWDLLLSGERSLSGHVHTEGVIGGTLADPTAVGQASVDNGKFADGATGLALENVVLRAGFANAEINVTEASGADGHGGTLKGSGRISLLRDGASSFRMDLNRFRLIDNDQAEASASGQATIDRNAEGKVRIAGALTIDQANVAADPPTPSGVVAMDVIERNKPGDLDGLPEPVARRGVAIALDVSLKAPRRIFLRGRGLDIELSLNAHVGGTTARPILEGTARVVRGDYDFAGKRFEFDDRGVVYLSTSPQNIRLSLTATRDDPTLTAVVQIRGTAAKPEITLTSTPVLPNDEVLSQVLFGRSAAQLSPIEAAQLASAISALAGGGGFDVIGNLRNFAGLDRLALGGDAASGGMTVAGGKYLTDDVYLELIGGGREGGAAQVEWRVRKNLSIISRLAGQGDARLAVRWRRDY